MSRITQGLAFLTGLVVLSGVGISSTLAFQPGDEEIAFSTKNLISEKLKIKLSAKFRKRNRSKRDRGALAAFYSERNYKTVWITGGRLNDRATQLVDELRNARTYGLNPNDYKVPVLSADFEKTIAGQLADAELMLSSAALTYMRHANGERFDQTKLSRFLDRKAKPIDAISKLSGLARATHPAVYLTRQHPTHSQFKALVAALAKGKTAAEPGERVRIPRGPVLKYGTKHPHIALIRRRLGVPVVNQVVDDRVYDAKLQTAIIAFQKSAGLKAEGVIGVKTRFALNAPKQNRHKQIIANMERWRWMPRSFGATNIRVNIPEYKVRVTRNNKIIHSERVIVGKPINKTPVFSDIMETVVFNPYWNVPQSIIWNEMHGRIPRAGYEGGVRHGRMWIRQNPGPRNALGKVKFLFPNKHAVYLHDTPSKALFNKSRRAFSHGCMRVRDPKRMAEVVLGMSGWSTATINKNWRKTGNKQVALKTKIPVHVTYFTLWADASGKLTSFNDVYGHDNRIYAAATKGVAYAKSRFPEVRKKKVEPRVARVDDYERTQRYQNWWFQDRDSNSYWSGRNTRRQKTRRVRIYRKKQRQRRNRVANDSFFSLF